MRSLLIPALVLITGMPTTADDAHREWKHRSKGRHHQEGSDFRPGTCVPHRPIESRRVSRSHMERTRPRPWHHRDEILFVRPDPVVIHVRPEPIPVPPVCFHFWFGF